MPPPLLVLLNPSAGSGRCGRLRRSIGRLLERSGAEYRLVESRSGADLEECAFRSVAEGFRRVAVIGGDGSLHLVVNGLLRARDAGLGEPGELLSIPLGTGNDFHRITGVPPTPEDALSLLDRGVSLPIDVGEVEWEGGRRSFVNLFGMGIDVAALEGRDRVRALPGILQYLAALGPALIRYRPIPCRIRVSGSDEGEESAFEELNGGITLLTATVGPSVGGGFRIAPRARPDDGLLDLAVVAPLSLAQAVRYIPRVIRGTHADLPVVNLRTFRRATVESLPQPFRFELDGELVPDEVHRVGLRVRPGALRLRVAAPFP